VTKKDSGRGKKSKAHEALKAAEGRIEFLAGLMRKPPKVLMESGNLPDLRRELVKARAKALELEGRLADFDNKMAQVEEEKSKLNQEADGLKRQDGKHQETLVSQWKLESEARQVYDACMSQVREEEASLRAADSEYGALESEAKNLERQLRESQARYQSAEDNMKSLPDRISRCDSAVTENDTMIADYERKINVLEKEAAARRAALESSKASSAQAMKAYEKAKAERERVEAEYAARDSVDQLLSEKDSLIKSQDELSRKLTDMDTLLGGPSAQKKALENQLAFEDEAVKQLKRSFEDAEYKIKDSESKLKAYSEVDSAENELKEAQDKYTKTMEELAASADKLKEASWDINQSKRDLQGLIGKEEQLKRNLDEVLVEKQKLEEELKSLSDNSLSSESPVIELPDVLRDAIRKETDRITAHQDRIRQLERTEHELAEQVIRLKEEAEKDQKDIKAKEKRFQSVRERMAVAGLGDNERFAMHRQLEILRQDQTELRSKMSRSDEEKRILMSQMSALDKENEKLREAAEEIRQKSAYAKARLIEIDSKLKDVNDAKMASWAGGSPLRMIYPLKAQMDRILGEKSRLRGELDKVAAQERRAKDEVDSIKAAAERISGEISSMTGEGDGLRAQISSLARQSMERKAEKQSLDRQLSEDRERMPAHTADSESGASRLRELQGLFGGKRDAKAEHERKLKGLAAQAERAKARVDAADLAIKATEEKISSNNKRIQHLSGLSSSKNTALIKLLNDKHKVEEEMAEYKKRQSVIESEMRVISGIYE